jgi:hypothetical protein
MGGAFGTSCLSNGGSSEVFFVLERDMQEALEVELWAASVLPERDVVRVEAELNGQTVSSFELVGEEPAGYDLSFPHTAFRDGLNRLVFHYERTVRLSRRHREAALQFFGLKLVRSKNIGR